VSHLGFVALFWGRVRAVGCATNGLRVKGGGLCANGCGARQMYAEYVVDFELEAGKGGRGRGRRPPLH
jgi:hypothetical protein